MNRIVKQINTKNELEKAFAIRKKVFVDGQGVPANEEYDEFDSIAHHYIVYINEVEVATARWRETQNGVKLERFAVLDEYRNQGIGSILLNKVLEDVPAPNLIYLHAQLPAQGLYSRAGFIVDGKMFLECDIEHYKMVKQV